MHLVVESPASPTLRSDPGRVLWVVTAAGWLVMLGLCMVPSVMASMPAMAAAGLGANPTTSTSAGTFALFLAGWVVMVTAMMLPTTVPMARMFSIVTSDVPERRRALVGFYGAYFVVWLVAGVLGLVSAVVVTRVTAGVSHDLVLAGALAIAGLFQFSPLKRRCLTKCRDPRAVLFTSYRRGLGGAWSLGLRHGGYCLGCCWSLMIVMFAVGSGGLIWMLGLTAVMVAEKTMRWGRRLVAPVGGGFLLTAAISALLGLFGHTVAGTDHIVPSPGQHQMHMQMQMQMHK